MKNNWVKVFNDLERDKQGQVLDLIALLEPFKGEVLNDIVVEIYSLSEEADNVDVVNLGLIELMDKVDYLSEAFNKMILKYDSKTLLIDTKVDSIIDKINEIIKDMSDKAMNFVQGNVSKYSHNINGNMVRTRLFIFRKRIIKIMNEFLEYDTTLNSEIDYMRDTINTIKRIAVRRVKKESDNLIKSMKEDNKKTKIFDYKEMNRLAKLKGYVQNRFNGDHLILIHNESRKAIVVPQKTIGKGLSFAIQKQIKTNSI